MADLFVDRFNSKGLASAYAIFNIFIALVTMGLANVGVYKVAQAMIVKPESAYTRQDWSNIADYREFTVVSKEVEQKTRDANDPAYVRLKSRYDKSELSSTISYVSPIPFYLAYGGIIGLYITLGGLRAAAITDAIQGLLILVMSVLLIPLGLRAIHGFSGLHAAVAPEKFSLFNDLTWFSVFGFFIASLVQIVGLIHNMSTAGSARDEDTARFGMISGGFSKRIVLICWTLCSLLALAILGNRLSDPDLAWGSLSRELLKPGLVGLMLSGMILGQMPSIGVAAVAISALITRNVYEPIAQGKSQRHYLRAGQISIAAVLLVAIVMAVTVNDVGELYTMQVTFNTFFGAAVILMYNWKRLTSHAVWIGLIAWVLGIILIPAILPHSHTICSAPNLLAKSRYKDPLFFDSIVLSDISNPLSPRIGYGRFHVENYVLFHLGMPIQNLKSSTLEGLKWLFDGLAPFAVLIVLSHLTPGTDSLRVHRFYAKMRTPVAPTPEEDHQQVQLSFENPNRLDHLLLFPRSNWQFKKWSRKDFIGFFGCWGIVLLILLLLVLVLRVGA